VAILAVVASMAAVYYSYKEATKEPPTLPPLRAKKGESNIPTPSPGPAARKAAFKAKGVEPKEKPSEPKD
jgi:hypothetical protein